ncbi:MAG TPA: D-2-hydroxyacid dehydrogenase [Burkholderiales bacterium]|nr:D-2-hydroxyacid dehydrogenase [Burkholderiales bacterium]
MTTVLVSHRCNLQHGGALAAAVTREHRAELLVLPQDPAARLAEEACARIEAAYFSEDIFPDHSRQFFSAVRKAPRLAWLHAFSAGVDHPIYAEMLERGVRLTTSSGTAAEPIAQTAIMGMLALARNLPHWLAAQRRRAWDPMRSPAQLPRDLNGQTALVLGLGHIGSEIARLARQMGLRVIGVRRSPRRQADPVDEMQPPQALPELLPRADWLFIACPLTAETRGLIDAGMIARLPRGARIVNIARGEIVRENDLIAALESGHLAGAYLDVFETEPLPADSPLWSLPNVLVSPHNAGAAQGNDLRVLGVFLENFRRWRHGEPFVNEVKGYKQS